MQDYLMTLLDGLAITLQLTAFSLLLGVLMGIFCLKEKVTLFKLSGVFLIFSGLIITALK